LEMSCAHSLRLRLDAPSEYPNAVQQSDTESARPRDVASELAREMLPCATFAPP
jgi:hypothetical protein